MNKIILGMVLLFSTTLFAQSLEEHRKKFGAEKIGIYLEDVNGKTFTYNADEIFHAASTMKVPVMMQIFRQVDAGKLKLDMQIKLKNEFTSIMDGSSFSLTKGDDSDIELYSQIGKALTLQELVERMINQSSNLATNTVIQLVGAENITQFMKEIGADGMTVLRGVEDQKAYDAGKNNTTSARALAMCMKAILNPKYFSDASREKMFRILASQHFQEGIAAGIDAKSKGLTVASKDGWLDDIFHDAAIIRDAQGRSSILVICSRGVGPEKGRKLIARIAADLWKEDHRVTETQR